MKPLTTPAIILALALASLGTTLPAQTEKTPQAKAYPTEEAYEKAYVDSYKTKGHVNAVPVFVEAPVVDPLLLEEQTLPFDVKVEFTVTEKGSVKRPVIKSDTDFEIAQYVIDAIYDWRFSPAIHEGKPVAERMLLVMEFIDSDSIPAPAPSVASTKTVKTSKGKTVASNVKLTPVATVAEK